ncbi:hypothetical protein F0562_009978 [Nyssa sinensis]|uniref:HMA domain-containing protein n=1 Tax=Nyssa sinensis TaxID=561372 RepID=A0A5J4ZXL3_9ASTE|nr:hypothetical protein F0562_009978 [Nyssa sinensis]
MEVLDSICGVYSVTIDAEQGTTKVIGEVDPSVLLRALARSGNHAELLWVNLKSPVSSRGYHYNDEYQNGPHVYGAINQPHRYQSALPEHSWNNTHRHYSPRRPTTEYPSYNTNYRYLPPAKYVPGPPPQAFDPYEYDEPINFCSVM